MVLASLNVFLLEQLRVLYAAEQQIAKSLPKLIEGVASSELKSLLSQHLADTEQHIHRLDQVAKQLHEKLSGARCRFVEHLLKEAVELTDRRGDERVIDAEIIALVRCIEGFEQSGYEIARSLCEVLDEKEVLKLISATLLDENRTEQSLTVLFEDLIDSVHEGLKGRPSLGLEESSVGG